MKVIEIRRHSIRGNGAHLNREGIALARRIGNDMPRAARVITSTLERAFETAIAMGFCVDERYEILSTMGDKASSEIFWDSPYRDFADKMLDGSALAALGDILKKLACAIAADIPPDGRALIITHGGIIQLIAAACLSGEDLSKLGGPPSYCEGVEIHYDNEKNEICGYKLIKL
jgi:hypothetical protein